ncbi:MAG: hypothetical protein V4517_00540 [Pseudomonadota bacterium]
MAFELSRQNLRAHADFRRNPLLMIGIVLACLPIALNVLWILPTPNVYPPIPGYSYATENRLSSLSDRRLARRSDESLLEFSGRLMTVVHDATYNCLPDQIGQSWWTYTVHLLGLLQEEQGLLSLSSFRCGFCHARAFILAEALRKGGITDATPLGIYGHVVTTFHIDGEQYVADPDFGIRPFLLPKGEPLAIRQAVEKKYLPIVKYHGILAIAELSDLYASVDDNRLYSFEYLANIRDSQDEILQWQRPIEIGVSLLGFAMIGLHMLLRRHQSRRGNRIAVSAETLAKS